MLIYKEFHKNRKAEFTNTIFTNVVVYLNDRWKSYRSVSQLIPLITKDSQFIGFSTKSQTHKDTNLFNHIYPSKFFFYRDLYVHGKFNLLKNSAP